MLPTKNKSQEKGSKSKSSRSLRKKSRKHLPSQQRNKDIESIYMNTIVIGLKKEQRIKPEKGRNDKQGRQFNGEFKKGNNSKSNPSTRYQNFIHDKSNPEIQKIEKNSQDSLQQLNIDKGSLKSGKNDMSQLSKRPFIKPKQNQNQKSKKNIKKQEPSPQQPQFICQICCRSMKKVLQVRLFDCQHAFCGQCIKNYVLRKIKAFQEIICPEQSCNNLLNEQCSFYQHLPAQTKQKYKRNKYRYKIIKDPTLKLCPTPNCLGILKLNDLNFVICDLCKKRMCKFCLLQQHQGQCEKNQVDFLQNVFQYRQCSKCKIVTQKKQGCNHITCKCKNQFCYRCGITWTNGHNCLQKANNQPVHPPVINRPVIYRPVAQIPIIPRRNQQSGYSCLCKLLIYILCWLIMIPLLVLLILILILGACPFYFTCAFFAGLIAGPFELFRQIWNSTSLQNKILSIILFPITIVIGMAKGILKYEKEMFIQLSLLLIIDLYSMTKYIALYPTTL